MMPVPSPQGDPKQLARPVGPREPEAPQGSERVWTHKGSGVGLYRFYAGVHPSRLGTARAGAPRGWLWGSYHPSGTSGSDSRLLPIKIAAAMHGSASGWLARALRMRWCRGAAVACQPSGGVQPCRRSARAGSGLLPPVPGARRRPRPRPRVAGSEEASLPDTWAALRWMIEQGKAAGPAKRDLKLVIRGLRAIGASEE